MKNIEEYLLDTKGNKSSTRLFSWMLLKFFMWFNGGIIILAGVILWLLGDALTPDTLFSMGVIWLVFDALLGIMIFAPKQLAKIQEIKELIEIVKK